MNNLDNAILNIDKNICKNISKFDESERGMLSQNILSQLRNFIEYISIKEYSNKTGENTIELNFENIKKGMKLVKTKGELRFLSKFHDFLRPVASHYTMSEEGSERLLLKYYEYLLKIKIYLYKEYNLEVLHNIEDFPIDIDNTSLEYYKKIVEQIKKNVKLKKNYDRYYIQKIKPFFINNKVFYEVTCSRADDYVSKFDRIIAFTELDIMDNYAVKLELQTSSIEILGKKMPIFIIRKWEVSIRPCEINNFAKIFGDFKEITTKNKEYQEMMQLLTERKATLLDFVNSPVGTYFYIKDKVTEEAKSNTLFNILDAARTIVTNEKKGSNIIRYLLYCMNNKTIKLQKSHEKCIKLSELYLDWKCIAFDIMPFCSSLKGHNPKIYDLLNCIDFEKREHEFLARKIKNNTEINGNIFTSRNEVEYFEDITELIKTYNSKIYKPTQSGRLIDIYNSHYYIRNYNNDVLEVIEELQKLSKNGIKNYTNEFQKWLDSSNYEIDSSEKREALREMFSDSKVALIYGPAGTGKSTTINHLSNFFDDNSKLYLAQTNPAVDNLKRKIQTPMNNCDFKTISKFTKKSNFDTEYDIFIIDECSTVSNSDMLKILEKSSFKLLVLVGDIYQIESIQFGNWFSVIKEFISKKSVFEITNTYRTKDNNLLDLWKKVRVFDSTISEYLVRNEYSLNLDGSIFTSNQKDEIILCLNYDGLYGINNINKFLQSNNPNPSIGWGINFYKVGDPILFNETNRFGGQIYNNLKGKILDIKKDKERIYFTIKVARKITSSMLYDFEILDDSLEDFTIIKFPVDRKSNTDEDEDSSNSVVPFQIAYAVSIHKSQGLEYNSVKIIITKEVDDIITHNIFYTAITRTKNNLKIYWSPESQQKILESFSKRDEGRNIGLLKTQLE